MELTHPSADELTRGSAAELTHPSVNRTDPPIQNYQSVSEGSMPRRRTMTEKREVIRRLRLGHSIRHINKTTGMHRTLIRRLKDLAQQNLWLDSEEPVPDEATIARSISPRRRGEHICATLFPVKSWRWTSVSWG
jgi:hypothetical protein